MGLRTSDIDAPYSDNILTENFWPSHSQMFLLSYVYRASFRQSPRLWGQGSVGGDQ